MPGSIPDMNSVAMDWLVKRAYSRKARLGGMSTPRVPPEATVPVARLSSYLKRFISGKATVPMVRAVARLSPHTAANPPQAPMVAMARPPGRNPSHLWAMSYKSLPMPE